MISGWDSRAQGKIAIGVPNHIGEARPLEGGPGRASLPVPFKRSGTSASSRSVNLSLSPRAQTRGTLQIDLQ